MKHGPKKDLEDLDFEPIDKEIEADNVAQSAQATTSEDPSASEKGNDAPPS